MAKTTRQMHPIATRVLAGENICPGEVREYNAGRIAQWVRTGTTHTKEECVWGKNCGHGPQAGSIDFAIVLAKEAAQVCTCGNHQGGA